MKCTTFLTIFACILSAALAFSDYKVDQVHSQVMSYVQENMADVRMMRGSAEHLACYDKFIPDINIIAQAARDNSKVCVDNSDKDKQDALEALRKGRSEVDGLVQRVQASFKTCSDETDSLGYFKCMIETADVHQKTLDSINSISAELIRTYQDAVQKVEYSENICLQDAVDKAKIETDSAFATLQGCLQFGTITTEAS